MGFDRVFTSVSVSLLFSHSFLCYLSGRRNPGLHFFRMNLAFFYSDRVWYCGGCEMTELPILSFSFLASTTTFFFLIYVGEGGILWFACPFHFMKFVHRVIWRNTQRCHMGNGRRLTWCLKLKMIGEIKFDF